MKKKKKPLNDPKDMIKLDRKLRGLDPVSEPSKKTPKQKWEPGHIAADELEERLGGGVVIDPENYLDPDLDELSKLTF